MYIPQEKYLRTVKAELQQRLNIISQWNIQPGSRILEIGCGQGDSIVILANLVGEEGHVTGVDPAPLDYGDPFTVAQVHANLKSSALGPRITFEQATLQEHLESNPDTQYDYAIFTHCLWYFGSPEELNPMLASLRGRAKRLLIAEFSLDARGDRTTVPHLLATLAQGEESSRVAGVNYDSNIRSLHTPISIKKAASEAGWVLDKESYVDNPPEALDGRREVQAVLSKEYEKGIACEPDEIRRRFAEALVEALKAAIDSLGPGEEVRTMSSWLGCFA
ncbi:S-adenosyl-L-methionine-dependent methyltransferase [Talaromyces proteolyticus]|uniref:S-adenosyl-L-methionine-dependent methyltransferase n=1 Tax=Talaromyces proteolyticus TaxID=1131652 RepID=A0AAD4KMY9_9EURO|nr:S-adenosyl-L-methionine-dependent methyltransferase [Talaromyces proteolyticus]KAH8694010.1 S-adenosyl-L-methionine-dependent methyltransferase [Talaromyces proteolyticus]